MLLAAAPVARAHPAGAQSVNRFLDFEYLGQGRFRVAYLLDFAEGPADAEIDAIDTDHDGKLTAEEQRAYLARRLPPLVDAWVVLVDGARAHPSIVASSLEVLPGEGGRETLRVNAELSIEGAPPPAGDLVLHVHDDTFAGQPGWREMRAALATGPDGSPVPFESVGEAGGETSTARRVLDATFVLRAPAPPAAAPDPMRVVIAVAIAALALLVALRIARRMRRG